MPLVLGGGNSNLLRVLTDAEGRFVFKNLPKGSFGLNATKAGYLDGAYGRLRPSGTSQSIDLADGDRQTDVKVRIFRTATIAGTVNDDQGEPVVGVSLRAYRRTYVSGRRLLTLAATSSPTDDRGMYG